MNTTHPDPVAAKKLREAIADVLHKLFDEYSFGSDETHDQWTEAFLAAITPHLPALTQIPVAGEARLSLTVGDVIDVACRLYAVRGVHLGAVGQDSCVELCPLDHTRAPYHTGSKNAFVPLAILALLNQKGLLSHER